MKSSLRSGALVGMSTSAKESTNSRHSNVWHGQQQLLKRSSATTPGLHAALPLKLALENPGPESGRKVSQTGAHHRDAARHPHGNLRASSSVTQSAEAGPKKEPLGQAEGLGLEGLRQPKAKPEIVNHKHHPHGQERETGTEQERRNCAPHQGGTSSHTIR